MIEKNGSGLFDLFFRKEERYVLRGRQLSDTLYTLPLRTRIAHYLTIVCFVLYHIQLYACNAYMKYII